MNMATTIRDCGVAENDFLAQVDEMAERAFEDQCTISNPRMPLVDELVTLYKKAYYGKI